MLASWLSDHFVITLKNFYFPHILPKFWTLFSLACCSCSESDNYVSRVYHILDNIQSTTNWRHTWRLHNCTWKMKTLYKLRLTLTGHHFFRQILRQRNCRYYIRYFQTRFSQLEKHILKWCAGQQSAPCSLWATQFLLSSLYDLNEKKLILNGILLSRKVIGIKW